MATAICRCADRLKVVVWDGSGLVLLWSRLRCAAGAGLEERPHPADHVVVSLSHTDRVSVLHIHQQSAIIHANSSQPETSVKMQNGIHFISGLPRSGSTLLAALLRQNPRFHATISSPLAALYAAVLSESSQRSEFGIFYDDAQRREILKGLFTGFYHAIHGKKLVFDANRAWCTRLSGLAQLYPQAKVICCVRHVSWIMDSIERLIQRNAFDLSSIFSFAPGGTVYTRVNGLATSEGLVGYALDALKQAFFGEHAGKLILVTYEALTRRPQQTLAAIYDFISEKPFPHDFNNLAYAEEEFDARLGTPGLHDVRRNVEHIERKSILPPELFARFEKDAFWLNPSLNRNGVRVLE